MDKQSRFKMKKKIVTSAKGHENYPSLEMSTIFLYV